MNIVYSLLVGLLLVCGVFFYGKHIGYQQAELEYQESSNKNNNTGNITNDKASKIDNSNYYNDITCKL